MKTVFLLVLSSLAWRGAAQSGWTLKQCINYAVTHNISLRQTGLNNEINKNNTTQAKAQTLPNANAGVNHNYNFGQTIDRFTNQFATSEVLSQNFFVSSSVVLWSGLSQYNNIKANEYNYLSGVENLKQQQNDLSLNVANAYIGVIFAEELAKISKNQMLMSQEQLERTEKLVLAGAASKSVEYDIKAQLANDQLSVTTADNNYQISVLTLMQLMNLDSVSEFKVDRPEIDMQDNQLLQDDVQSVYQDGLKTQPSIKKGEYAILSSERVLAANRGKVSPTLTFNASLGTGTSGLAKDVLGATVVGYQPIGATSNGDIVYSPVTQLITKNTPLTEQFKRNLNKTLGFTLSIPIFNGLQTNTAVKNAKLNALNARFAQDLTKQNLYKNIAQAYVNAKASLNKYNASKLNVDAANESFKYAQQKFNAGAINAFDFTTAKNRLFAAESNLLQAKYDYVFKLKVLDYYKGKPLEL